MFLRVNRFGAYTPVVQMLRGDRKVTLVGMLHIAELSYYQKIQKLLDSLENDGFKILVERIISYRTINCGSKTASRLMKENHLKEIEIVSAVLNKLELDGNLRKSRSVLLGKCRILLITI